MIQSVIDRTLDSAEQRFGVPGCMAYLREIACHSRAAFAKFMLFMPLASHRKTLPPAPYHLARIVAARYRDCGACVQMEINEAQRQGVSPASIRHVLNDEEDQLPEGAATAAAFARAVVHQQPVDDRRNALIEAYGEEAVGELSIAIASAAFFPTVKRAMGYGERCSLPELLIGEK